VRERHPVTVDIESMTAGLSVEWTGFLRDWHRSLRSANHPATTRYNYVLAAAQLARYLGDHGADLDEARAAETPVAVTRHHLEAFQAWMLETRSASTAVNKYKALQQFFRWLAVDEEAIEESPMRRLRQPRTATRLIPIISDEDTAKVLDTCKGRQFLPLRDEAIIRLLYNTGARLSEVANLLVDDVDLALDTVRYHGKGAKDRRVRIGPKTARSISRYLRARSQHPGAGGPELWLAMRGARPLAANGIKLMLRRRGAAAGVPDVHAHRWRHSYAHQWKLAGGDTGDLMLVLGWTSDDMPRHYGASAAAERAQQVQARLGIGERV
jgi:integrase/recombinase XerC